MIAVSRDVWREAQKGEADYWGDQELTNDNVKTEIRFQKVYADWMKIPPDRNMQGANIIDIGGGPVSLLLQCHHFSAAMVVDPLPLKECSADRYKRAVIGYHQYAAEDLLEDFPENFFDEAWIYNCLAHVMDPGLILRQAKRIAKRVRIFEVMIEVEDYMHPWKLNREFFEGIMGKGDVSHVNDEGVIGEAFFGVFEKQN